MRGGAGRGRDPGIFHHATRDPPRLARFEEISNRDRKEQCENRKSWVGSGAVGAGRGISTGICPPLQKIIILEKI